MKRLLKYLKGYIKETVLSPLFKLLEATLELIVPLVIANIIDRGIGEGNKSYTLIMSLILVFVGIVGLGFSVVAQYFAAKASVGFITQVKHGLYSHISTLSYSDIDRVGTSTLITRMTADASKVQTGVNLTLRLLLRSPFVVFGAMIMAFTIDVKSGVSFAITIPILAIIVFGIMLLNIPMYKRVQEGVDGILTKTRENLSGVRVIRAFGKEEEEIKNFREKNSYLTKVQKRAGNVSALMNPLTYIVINLGIVFLVYTGALRVNSGDLTQGEVIALYNYMSQILVELVKLANLIITITKATASATRISDLFDLETSQHFGNTEKGESDLAVELNGVSIAYNEHGENSLENITLSVKRGETVGIIGGTGSGKTTLVNLIARFYDATEGEVKLFGVPVKNYSKEALNRIISVVPQKAVLFSGSIRDNVKWGNQNATDEEIMRAIEVAQATDVVAAKGGLDAEINAGGKNLSGGQRQRLTVARAIVANSDILILDDSSSALDYATDSSMRQAIKKISNGKTVFIVSQRTSSVMHCDKIIVLDDGMNVGLGTHEELLKNSEVYREIYDSQFAKEGRNENNC